MYTQGERARAIERRAIETSMDFIVGVDLGQATDYTAICILQRLRPLESEPGASRAEAAYHLRYLERVPLGTKYPDIAARVLAMLNRSPLTRHTPLVVDNTGVGRAIVDMFVAEGIEPWALTIQGGNTPTRDGHDIKVPKRELVSTLLALYQTGRLKVAQELELVPIFTKELLNFRIKINLDTGHDTYEAWREKDHDDIVLAVAVAAWFAENEPAPIEQIDPEVADIIQNGWRRDMFG